MGFTTSTGKHSSRDTISLPITEVKLVVHEKDLYLMSDWNGSPRLLRNPPFEFLFVCFFFGYRNPFDEDYQNENDTPGS